MKEFKRKILSALLALCQLGLIFWMCIGLSLWIGIPLVFILAFFLMLNSSVFELGGQYTVL